MKRSSTACWILAWLVAGLGTATVAGGKLIAQQGQQRSLPDDNGKDVVVRMCDACHPMETVTSPRYSEDRWASVVDDMVAFGVQGTDEDIEIVIQYLAKHFGPEKPRGADARSMSLPKVNVNTAGVPELAAVLQLSVEDARAIVGYRDKNGKFKTWQDLEKVAELSGKEIELKKGHLVF